MVAQQLKALVIRHMYHSVPVRELQHLVVFCVAICSLSRVLGPHRSETYTKVKLRSRKAYCTAWCTRD
jgi:hypothetical protein